MSNGAGLSTLKYCVNRSDIKEGDWLCAYSSNNRWKVVKIIDFRCEHKAFSITTDETIHNVCNLRHRIFIVKHRSEYQTWSYDHDDYFWERVFTPRNAKRYEKDEKLI